MQYNKCSNVRVQQRLWNDGEKHFLCKMYFVVCSQWLHFPFNSWDSYNFQGFIQHSIYCTSPASEAWIWVKIVSNRSEVSEAGKAFKRNVFPLWDINATTVQTFFFSLRLSLLFMQDCFNHPNIISKLVVTNQPLICYRSIKGQDIKAPGVRHWCQSGDVALNHGYRRIILDLLHDPE